MGKKSNSELKAKIYLVIGITIGILLMAISIVSISKSQVIYLPLTMQISKCDESMCTFATWQSLGILGGIMLIIISILFYSFHSTIPDMSEV